MSTEELSELEKLIGDGEDNFSLIDPKAVDAAAEIGKTCFTGGCEAWGVLLGRGVMFTEGETVFQQPSIVLPTDIQSIVVTTIQWTGDRTGECFLVLPEFAAKGVVAYMMRLMMGEDTTPETTELNEEGMDAYVEAVNNFLGSASQALRGALGIEMNLEAGETKLVDLTSTPAEEVLGEQEHLCHSGQISIEEMVPVSAYFFMAPAVTGIELIKEQSTNATIEDLGKGTEGSNKPLAMHLKVPVRVLLAEKRVRMEVIQTLAPGSIIEFRKLSGELLDVCANGVKFAEGEVVIVNEHFGVQVRKLIDIRAAILHGS